jgi:hypothetical protein
MKKKVKVADEILKYLDMLQEEEDDDLYEDDDVFEDKKPKGKIKIMIVKKIGKKKEK